MSIKDGNTNMWGFPSLRLPDENWANQRAGSKRGGQRMVKKLYESKRGRWKISAPPKNYPLKFCIWAQTIVLFDFASREDSIQPIRRSSMNGNLGASKLHFKACFCFFHPFKYVIGSPFWRIQGLLVEERKAGPHHDTTTTTLASHCGFYLHCS